MEKDLEKFAIAHNYSLDYLTCGSPIFQVKDLYTFTSDSIELAHFVDEEKINKLVDLCSGSGVVGLEVVGTKEVASATLVELQSKLAECASDSAKLNKHPTKIEVLNTNVKNVYKIIGTNSVDVITCNPPYFKVGSGDVPTNLSKAMARHEITLSLEDIIKEAHTLLKTNGCLYLIHIESRKKEISKLLKVYNFNIIKEKILDGKLKRIIIKAQKCD